MVYFALVTKMFDAMKCQVLQVFPHLSHTEKGPLCSIPEGPTSFGDHLCGDDDDDEGNVGRSQKREETHLIHSRTIQHRHQDYPEGRHRHRASLSYLVSIRMKARAKDSSSSSNSCQRTSLAFEA